MRHHAGQLFHLVVLRRHREFMLNPSEATFGDVTVNRSAMRVMVADREPVSWEFRKMRCLTVVSSDNDQGSSIVEGAVLQFQDCSHDARVAPLQFFLPVESVMTGTTARSSIGTLRVAANPTLCVMKSKDKNNEVYALAIDDSLVLNDCNFEGRLARMGFEFELAERFI